ncbi:MAG TPA: ankyrin repeat domain-containing protein [Candidatus Rifleibacterium sp.]|nr:ankyrin repeat domain-containing protein [Candidatus Rifleibacterium sp.]HPT46659.1 ankyrin repeat domain-containing protein [Candidatus Rifleibacterium sp.]
MLPFSGKSFLCFALCLLLGSTGFAQLADPERDDFGEVETSGPAVETAAVDDSLPDGDVKPAIMTVLENEPFRLSTAFLKKAVENGADINARNSNGESVLIRAIRTNCSPEIIDFLLKNGADPFATDNIGLRDMETIVESESCVELLPVFLKNGVDINYKNADDGESLLAHAIAFENNLRVAEKLIELGANIDLSALIACSSCHDKDFFNKILAKTPDVNEGDKNGRTALMAFSENCQDVELIKALIDKGAKLETRDKEKNTALILAASQNRNPEIAATLIEKGADLNAANRLGRTPFLAAVERGNTAAITMLINKGAKINALTSKEETALHLAVNNSHKDCEQLVKDLLDAGVDATLMDDECRTAYDIAEYNCKDKLASEVFKRLKIECSKNFIAKD